MEIKSAAKAYVESYANAIDNLREAAIAHSEQQTNDPEDDTVPWLTEHATALASHYGPNFTSYTSGVTNTSGSPSAEIESVRSYLERFVRSGLGLQLRLVKSRVEVVSQYRSNNATTTAAEVSITSSDVPSNLGGSALCHLTWSLEPQQDGLEGWSWENVYCFRLVPGQTTLSQSGGDTGHNREKYVTAPGYWEFVVSDNEINELVKRVPNFFSDMFGRMTSKRTS